MEETRGVLVMFDASLPPEAVALTLDSLEDMIIGWARVFDDKPLYAVKVKAGEAASWKESLRALPGATWSEVMLGSPRFEQVNTYH